MVENSDWTICVQASTCPLLFVLVTDFKNWRQVEISSAVALRPRISR